MRRLAPVELGRNGAPEAAAFLMEQQTLREEEPRLRASAASGGSRRIGWSFLAMGETGLLLAGAIHEVARPLLHAPARFDAQYQERLTLESKTTALRKNPAAYHEMAAGQGRQGVVRHPLIRQDELLQGYDPVRGSHLVSQIFRGH